MLESGRSVGETKRHDGGKCSVNEWKVCIYYQVADFGVLLRWAEVGVKVGIVGVVVVGLVTGGTWLQLMCCALV